MPAHLGTKEDLIGQALAAARPDIPALLAGHAAAGHPPAEIAARLWHDLATGGQQEPRTRLLIEVMALALTQPDPYPLPRPRPPGHPRMGRPAR